MEPIQNKLELKRQRNIINQQNYEKRMIEKYGKEEFLKMRREKQREYDNSVRKNKRNEQKQLLLKYKLEQEKEQNDKNKEIVNEYAKTNNIIATKAVPIVIKPIVEVNEEIEIEKTNIKPLKTKNLQDSTINTYIKSIEKIVNLYDCQMVEMVKEELYKVFKNQKGKKLKFINDYFQFIENDPNKCFNLIKDKIEGTKDILYASITSLSSRLKNMKKTYNLFSVINRDKIKEEYKKDLDNKKTESDIIINLDSDLIKSKLDSFENNNKLIFALYTLIPPRRLDYSNMKISYTGTYDTNGNYYDFVNKKFIFNDYKTKRHYGQIIADIPSSLIDIIDNWCELNKDLNTFPTITPYIINKIFKMVFDIKNISVNCLRHSYLTKLNNDGILSKMTETERHKLALDMMHSRNKQNIYIKI